MSDLFQPAVPDAYIEDVVRVMVEANWHTYQVLTKRSERLRDLLSTKLRFASGQRHIWWGVSVEDRRHGLPRVRHLRSAPAAVKFLSIEPLLEDLGSFDISGIDWAIIGGESGHGARPLDERWVLRLFKLCRREDVDFFFKQWGGVHKSTTGRLLHGQTYDEMPDLSAAEMPSRAHRQSAALRWKNKAQRWMSPPAHMDMVPLQAVGCLTI